jgi:WD40 repeat protein
MNDDKFLYELREEMPSEFGKKLYQKLQGQERQRSFVTLAAALLVTLVGVTILFARFALSDVPDTAQVSLTNLQPITTENISQIQQLRTLGNGTVNGVTWSPDETTITVASSQGVFLHHADDLSIERQLSREVLYTPTYSPDGSILAGFDESTIVLLSASTGEVLRRIETANLRMIMLKFSADGTQLATNGCQLAEEGIARDIGLCATYDVQLWDVESGEEINSFDVGLAQAVAISDDFTLLAWVDDASDLQVRSTTSNQIRVLANGYRAANPLIIGFRGDQLVAINPRTQNPARVWDNETIFEATEELQVTENIEAGAFPGPNGTQMWFLNDDKVLILRGFAGVMEQRNLSTGAVTPLPNHIVNIQSMAVNGDGTKFVMLASGAVIVVLDTDTGEHLAILRAYDGYASTLVFSPDGTQLLTTGSPNNERIWDLETETSRLLFPDESLNELEVDQAIFNPDATRLAYSVISFMAMDSGDSFMQVSQGMRRYDLTTEEETTITAPAPFNSNPIDGLFTLDDGTLLVVQSRIRTISRIAPDDTITSVPMQGPNASEALVWSFRAAFSANGSRVAMAICDVSGESFCDDRQVFVWDTTTGELLYRLQENPESQSTLMAFSQDGNVLAVTQCNIEYVERGRQTFSYCHGGIISLWDVTGEASEEIRAPLAVIDTLGDSTYGVAFSPISEGGNLLLVASVEDRIEGWQVNSAANEVTALGTLTTLPTRFAILTFSPNGEILAISGVSGIQLWGVPEH